jgi:hypothetical protein
MFMPKIIASEEHKMFKKAFLGFSAPNHCKKKAALRVRYMKASIQFKALRIP